jgi:hypothetical protein
MEAIAILRRDGWAAAHRLAQADDSVRGAWFHGILHIIEGDEGNARYWYQRAGRPFPGLAAAEAELTELAASG